MRASVLIVFLGLPANLAAASEITVPGGAPTIQAAVDAARDGDTILVAEGMYRENIEIAGKAITVRGIGRPWRTVIDGGGTESAVRILPPGATLEGLKIVGGLADRGGGIWVGRTGSSDPINVTFKRLLVEGNEAREAGGGIAVHSDLIAPTNVWIETTLVAGNRAARSGGILIEAFGNPVYASIVNCTVADNRAASEGAGLGMTNDVMAHTEGDPISFNSIFWHNRLDDSVPFPDGDPDVAGLWHFDEGFGTTAADATGWNQGSVSGAEWTSGRFGSGLFFDGGSGTDNVVVPHSSSLDLTGPFTIEAWIKAEGTVHYMAIADKYSGGEDSKGFSLYLTGGKARLSTYNAPSSCDVFGATDLRDDAWHYLAAVWDGTGSILYVDGAQDGISPCTMAPASTDADLGLGERLSGWGGTMPFFGTIDEVRISGIARSAQEIAARYAGYTDLYGLRPGMVRVSDIGDGQFAGKFMNISGDPLFRDALAGDYRLANGSPCIDAGVSGIGSLPAPGRDFEWGVPWDDPDVPNTNGGYQEMGFDIDSGTFIRGDADGDMMVDVSDTIYTFEYLFMNAFMDPLCLAALDANDDEELDISDPLYILVNRFMGGPRPNPPFEEPGLDPEGTALPCHTYPKR
jgi:hypothetical protein